MNVNRGARVKPTSRPRNGLLAVLIALVLASLA